jgi:hypothetical protein
LSSPYKHLLGQPRGLHLRYSERFDNGVVEENGEEKEGRKNAEEDEEGSPPLALPALPLRG